MSDHRLSNLKSKWIHFWIWFQITHSAMKVKWNSNVCKRTDIDHKEYARFVLHLFDKIHGHHIVNSALCNSALCIRSYLWYCPSKFFLYHCWQSLVNCHRLHIHFMPKDSHKQWGFIQLRDDLIGTKRQSKSFHQNIIFAFEQCGCCLNPPNKSYIFTPLICTTKSLFARESYSYNRQLISIFHYVCHVSA